MALAGILLISVGWWVLALWPLDPTAPAWLVRTREVCFGASRQTLPSPVGWALLVGEPLGLLAMLVLVWGDALRADLRRLNARPRSRAVLMLGAAVVVLGLGATVRRVRNVTGWGVREAFVPLPPLPERDDRAAETLALVDQHGDSVRLTDFRGRWVLVTFAFAHCADICPAIVADVRRVRAAEGATDVPLLIVTLDPWRDAPPQLPGIARDWALRGEDRILSGEVATVTAALNRWRIGRVRDGDTGDVLHGSVVVLVDPEGREAWRIEGAIQRLHDALRARGAG